MKPRAAHAPATDLLLSTSTCVLVLVVQRVHTRFQLRCVLDQEEPISDNTYSREIALDAVPSPRTRSRASTAPAHAHIMTCRINQIVPTRYFVVHSRTQQYGVLYLFLLSLRHRLGVRLGFALSSNRHAFTDLKSSLFLFFVQHFELLSHLRHSFTASLHTTRPTYTR